MSTPLNLADPETAVDAQTFASRAARVGDGAVRLRASGGILVMSCAPIAPRGILDTAPTILGVRALAADPELVCDLVVDGASLRAHGVTLELPDAGVRAAWAGISPPVSGWTVTGEIASTDLAAAAHRGMEEVATSVRAIRGWISASGFDVMEPRHKDKLSELERQPKPQGVAPMEVAAGDGDAMEEEGGDEEW